MADLSRISPTTAAAARTAIHGRRHATRRHPAHGVEVDALDGAAFGSNWGTDPEFCLYLRDELQSRLRAVGATGRRKPIEDGVA
ncbi:MAG TPA: hypothetical protein VFB99_20260 [Vicinamibacterales bacterium]|nr:hypothetical protein [Vicinamibacterales bacterium]